MNKKHLNEVKNWVVAYGYADGGSALAKKIGVTPEELRASYSNGLSLSVVSLLVTKCSPMNIEFFAWYASRISGWESGAWDYLAEELGGFEISLLDPISPSPLSPPTTLTRLKSNLGISSEREIASLLGISRSTTAQMKYSAYSLPPKSIHPISKVIDIDELECFLAAIKNASKDKSITTSLIDVIWANVIKNREKKKKDFDKLI